MRGRLAQLFDMKKVPFEPAVSVERWDETTTLGICERWAEGQRKQPSIVGLARLSALNLERARPESIPADMKDQRLLPEGSKEEDYYREMIETFLKTVGLDDTDAVIDSFKKTGTGALHRQRVTVSSTVNGAVSVAQLAASAHLPTKTALSGVQLLLTLLSTELAFDSANIRFRNSGTEEIMPLGKADATPSAKTGPNVMRASARLALQLHKLGNAVRKMERAQADFDDAHQRLTNPNATPQQRQKADQDMRAAGTALSVAYARFCMRMELKSDYKTASESAKIEYHGNKRAFGASVASGTATYVATLLGILTPVVVSSFAVTAGVTAGAVALAAALYVAHQLSAGPSKDGEAKAKRAIVALAKSSDLFAGNAAKQQKERAEAYRTYIAEKRVTNNPEVRKQAKARLVAKLEEIAQRDSTKDDHDPVKNWTDYTALRRQIADAGADDTTVKALEESFVQAHASQFKTSTVSDAWKTPDRMRFDSMGRLLLGKVSESLASLHDFNAEAERRGPRHSRRQAAARTPMHAGRRAEIKACLRDWLHFELAQSRMKAAVAEKDPVQARNSLKAAAQALAAIENANARALFSTDARKQVDATKIAKSMAIGERERYTMTNAGPAALAAAVNLSGSAASLGLNVEKVVLASHGVHQKPAFGDQNDARLFAQSTAPVTAPYSAGERARFQKTSMAKLVGTLAREGEPVVTKLELPATNAMLLDLGDRHSDASLDKLIDELEAMRDIPDEIAVSVGGAKLSSAKLSGTTPYYNWRYRHAPLATKTKFRTRQAGMLADSLAISVATPIAHAVAQVPLSKTRATADRGKTMSAGVRERLTSLATQAPPSEAPPPSESPLPGAVETAPIDSEPSVPEVQNGSPRARDAAAPASEESQGPAASFDAQAAALALRSIPELGGSARVTHSDMPAARPERVFVPRPEQAAIPTAEREEPRELERQRDMMMGAGRDETLHWFEQQGLHAADNSGHASMDCLIISLLQHATGRYDAQSEPLLAAQAARYREALAGEYPEIERGDRMLYDDEPAIAALMQRVNSDYGVNMNLQLIMPSVDGPVRFQASALGTDPVGVVMFGNHFQAVHLAGARAEESVVDTRSESSTSSSNTAPVTESLTHAMLPAETEPASSRVEAWLSSLPVDPRTIGALRRAAAAGEGQQHARTTLESLLRAPSLSEQSSLTESTAAATVGADSRRWVIGGRPARFDANAKTTDGGKKPVKTKANDELARRIKVNERAQTLYEYNPASLPKDTKKNLRSGEWAFDKRKSTGRAVLASYKDMVKNEHRVLKADDKTRRARLRELAERDQPDEPLSD